MEEQDNVSDTPRSNEDWEEFENEEKKKLIALANDCFEQIEKLAIELGENPLKENKLVGPLNQDPGWKNINEEGTDQFVVSSKPLQGILLGKNSGPNSQEGSICLLGVGIGETTNDKIYNVLKDFHKMQNWSKDLNQVRIVKNIEESTRLEKKRKEIIF